MALPTPPPPPPIMAPAPAGAEQGGGNGQGQPPQPPLSPKSSGSRRDAVAKEILDSETTFVEQMATLVAVFIKPLRWWQAEIAGGGGKESMHPPLPDLFLAEIFANIEQLLIFNRHVVAEFSDIYRTTKAFGAFFKKAAPFFKMYSAYVSNYDRAMETLIHLVETRLDFAAFVRACELQESCKGLNLRAYLIMPVQRIPRYKLLLTELLKHTPEDHADYADLCAAVQLVSGVVTSINEDIKRQEKRFKVMEVQERFDTALVTASRKHEREGELIKMCRQGPKKFTFVLFNDLLIYGAQKLTSEKCSLHRKMDLGELFIIDSGRFEASFIVATRAKAFVCQCQDLGEKKEWLAAFRACFAEMAKTVVYGKNRVLKADHKPLASLALWMVRDGAMVRENYLLPPLPPDQTYGLLDFADLRLIVDPHATGPDRGSVGTRVMSKILRRGGNLAQYNFKVQPEHPVPCEVVGGEVASAVAVENGGSDDDDSTFADALSPRSSASASPINLDALIGSSSNVAAAARQRRETSPGPDGPPLPQLNDAGFQTASGFVDGRMSGKWNNILTGLRPTTTRTGATPSPPLLGAQGALREHEMLQLERSMAAMGLTRAGAEAAAAGAEAAETAASAPQRKSPPPAVQTTAPSDSKTPMPPPPAKPTSPLRLNTNSPPPATTAAALGAPAPPGQWSSSSLSSGGGPFDSRGSSTDSLHRLSADMGRGATGGSTAGSDSGGSRPNSLRVNSLTKPAKAPRSPRTSLVVPAPITALPSEAQRLLNAAALQPPPPSSSAAPPPPTSPPHIHDHDPLPTPPTLAPGSSSSSSLSQTPGSEYTAVLPVCDFGLGLFLRDEQGEVVIGGFRSPKHSSSSGGAGAPASGSAAAAVNPSVRAGIRIGDVLLRVNNVKVTSVAHTIAVLRDSRLEQVIALTLRRGNGGSGGSSSGGSGILKLVNYSPPKPKSRGPSPAPGGSSLGK